MRIEFPKIGWNITILAPDDTGEITLTLYVQWIPVQRWSFYKYEIAEAIDKLRIAEENTGNPYFRDMYQEAIDGLLAYGNNISEGNN